MTGDGVSAPCTNAGVLHYTSTQIEDALAAIIKADDVAADQPGYSEQGQEPS